MSSATATAVATGSYRLLGTRVSCVDQDAIVDVVKSWADERGDCRFVVFCNVHMIMEARRNEGFARVMEAVDLCCPDGMPLAWVGRMRGEKAIGRASGPDVMLELCRRTAREGYRHFFYGGRPGVAAGAAEKLSSECPGLQIAGTYSPPFRPLSREEDDEIVSMINASRADFLWVGLGCPKQETWIYEHRSRLRVPVALAVGQAFDIFAETLRRAPVWMQRTGLEWLFRFASEPRRLWRRYLVYNSLFLYHLALESLRNKPQ